MTVEEKLESSQAKKRRLEPDVVSEDGEEEITLPGAPEEEKMESQASEPQTEEPRSGAEKSGD